MLPNAKIVISLCNPIDRAWSQYKMNVARGVDGMEATFAKSMESNAHNLRQNYTPFAPFWYIERGLYAEQLERWASVFSMEQILIVYRENFETTAVDELNRVTHFLCIRPIDPLSSIQNVRPLVFDAKGTPLSAGYSNDEIISAETREFLRRIFEPHNRRLCILLLKYHRTCPLWATAPGRRHFDVSVDI
jgi:hypothetical protein